MIDLSRIIPLIETMSSANKQEHLNLWRKNLANWQEDLNSAKAKGFEVNVHLEMIAQIRLIIHLLEN
jgi:hypothetical protein